MSAGYQPPAGARCAASLILLRQGDKGPEVLMLRRAERDADMRSGVCVFPGGVLDAADSDLRPWVVGPDDAEASAWLGVAAGGLDFLVAAVRETFEEVGLLLACRPDGSAVDAEVYAAELAAWRGRLHRGEAGLAALCDALGLRLDLRPLAYYSHWLTPLGMPKRFDTRFFIAPVPVGQQAEADYGEAQELMWLTPAQALDPSRGLKLLPVTRRTLKDLSRFTEAETAWSEARMRRNIALTQPRLATTRRGPGVVLPDELAWAEIGRLDPTGRGDVSSELRAGVAVRLSERLIRVTAPNPGPMTGPGTNSYFVGDPQAGRWLLVDPGPADAGHLQALLAAAPGPLVAVMATHSHIDHSPGAVAAAAAFGVPVWGRRPRIAQGHDPSFAPVRELVEGERLQLGESTTLQVLHTPGHASNHLCLHLLQERTLLTGDHVMQGSTVVINPPDGDMREYIRQLERLLALDLEWLAPGHGFLVADPPGVIKGLIAHRRRRGAKVAEALARLGGASLDELLPAVYEDVPRALYPVARRSLLAHLIELCDDGLATEGEGRWQPVTPALPASDRPAAAGAA